MSSPLLLHDTHAAAGAAFSLMGRREMVASYGDAAAEARAIRERAGVIDWGGGTRLRLGQGGTRSPYEFIQSMVSNDVPEPPTDDGCYAALLTNTGKIVADCRVWAQPDGILLANESAAGTDLRASLEKYGFLDDITVEDISDALGMFGVYGPDSAGLLETALQCSLPGIAPHALVPVTTGQGNLLVTRSAASGEVGFDLLMDTQRARAVWEALTAAGGVPVGLDAFHVVRVEAGVPWMGAELDEQVLPNQANLEHAVSYTKGCYVGQEPVAKLHYLGHSNRRLVGLLLGDAPPPERDTPVTANGKKAGRITSAVASPVREATIAMAMCKSTFSEPGTELTVGENIPAIVTALPFYRRADEAQAVQMEMREDEAPPPAD